MNRPRTTIAVIGAGSWGTALAKLLAERAHDVRLWVREPELLERLRKTRENSFFLPDIVLPSNLVFSGVYERALEGAEVVLSAVPSHVCREVYVGMRGCLRPDQVFVSATKGLEENRLKRMSEVIRDELSPLFRARIAVLSGPSFAREVAKNCPTAVTLASEDEGLANRIQALFSTPHFRLYTNQDVVGVEMGGALKNVIAIAAGIVEGLGLGANAMAALVTRGLVEIKRLGTAVGAKSETFSGLSGLGDLVLTCTGSLSRNRSVGVRLGKGESLSEILKSMRMVAEGVRTTSAALELARKHAVEMPITEEMKEVIEGRKGAGQGVADLMGRALKGE